MRYEFYSSAIDKVETIRKADQIRIGINEKMRSKYLPADKKVNDLHQVLSNKEALGGRAILNPS